MQLESLKVFCDLAETKSFTKTAQTNDVTQSAVSQTITALEKSFKSPLVERSKKNFRLTVEGEVVYEYSKRMLEGYEAAKSAIEGLHNVISGEVRVSTVYSIGLHELPPCQKQFLTKYPGVKLQIQFRRANQVYDAVLSNLVDLGLVAYPVRDPKLELVSLSKDFLVLVCHPKHPFAKQKSIKPKELQGQKYVNFEKDIPTRKALDKLFKAHGVTVNTLWEFDNVETVKGAVEINAGVAILPALTVAQEVTNKTLAAVRLEGDFVRERAVIYKQGKILSPAMKVFIDLLKKAL
jgi:DNA-binding transcriptional LysR family regulator